MQQLLSAHTILNRKHHTKKLLRLHCFYLNGEGIMFAHLARVTNLKRALNCIFFDLLKFSLLLVKYCKHTVAIE